MVLNPADPQDPEELVMFSGAKAAPLQHPGLSNPGTTQPATLPQEEEQRFGASSLADDEALARRLQTEEQHPSDAASLALAQRLLRRFVHGGEPW